MAPHEVEGKRQRPRQLSESASWYEANAGHLIGQYESLSPDELNAWLRPYLPESPSRILDVGAGTGRDAAWLSGLRHDVIAVEPSARLREAAEELHAGLSVQWIDDELPALDKIHRLGLSFDFILVSAVWMHVAPSDRARAFRKLITLLEPGGAIALTLRHGPAETGRGIFAVSLSEIEQLSASHGAFVQKAEVVSDNLGRREVAWTQVLVRLPDDGAGALPLLRHIILNDNKSSTYKLALLRVLCRIADGTAGFARESDNGLVAIPLGLVGLFWLRLFKPLLAAGLPQTPRNMGLEGLGFVKDAFRRLAIIPALELRIGSQFGESAPALHAAIHDACQTICVMPATFITYPNGNQVFQAQPARRVRRPPSVSLDEAYLSSFGKMLIPDHLWRAFRRFDVWIEPALIAEWIRLMRAYALNQARNLDEAALSDAMTWADPTRQVGMTRERALTILASRPLYCVWTGKRLTTATLDIDHCIPWSAWPCDDLWNLLPADRVVNQRHKREKMPSPSLLRAAQPRIKEWWETGYVADEDLSLRNRFTLEAKASLPLLSDREVRLDDVFDGLALLQLRLSQDQRIPLWSP